MITGTNVSKHYPYKSERIIAARLHSDGTLDDDFGNSGKMFFKFPGFGASSKKTCTYSDGKFFLWGPLQSDTTSEYSNLLMIHFNADGNVDSSFGPNSNGILINPLGPFSLFQGSPFDARLAITPDEKIVLAGTNLNGFPISRYNSDGSNDATFGSNGQVYIDGQLGVRLGDIAIQPDGKIVIAGDTYFDGDPNFTLFRVLTDGSLDSSFGVNGKVINDLADYGCYIHAVALQEDGKIVVAGFGEFNARPSWILARYKSNGQLDASFGTGGIVRTNFSEGYEVAYNLFIDAQHSIYASGSSSGWSIAKYHPGNYTQTHNPIAQPIQAQISPNLSRPGETAVLHYHLSKSGTVSIELLNAQGQHVQTFSTIQAETSGEQTCNLTRNKTRLNRLPCVDESG